MIAVDTNILVYAHRSEAPDHAAAATALRELSEGSARWAIPWPCLHEFMAVVTRPRYLRIPSTRLQACEQIEAWLESPGLTAIAESARHWITLRALIAAGNIVGNQVHDAKIAAVCLDAGVSEFWSAERDFSRYPTLRTRNPLVTG